MTYDQIIDQIKQHPDQFGYALDYTGWYLYILDPADETWPEPVAYDLQLDEYRDAYGIEERGRSQTGWWLSYTKPEKAIESWLSVKTPNIAAMLAEWHGKPEEHKS